MGNTKERVCAIYTRVPTEEQAKKGYSLSEQKKRLTDYCEYNDFKIYKYYEDDGISAKTGNYRPAFEQMIKDRKDKKFDTILAIKLDRISRSVYDMEVINKMLSDNELDLICIFESFDTTNANGRMVQRIMTSVAQNEIEGTNERTKIGIQLANEMWGDEFQVVVTTHLNTNHVHNHFVVNSVSMKDGHKYNYSNHEMARLRQTNDFICKEYGLSSLEEKVTRKNFNFSKYMNHDNYSTITQRDIDIAIKNSFNYQDFINSMKKINYEVIERYGKLSVKHTNMKRNIRIERQFGDDYTIDNIYRRIAEEVPDKLTADELTTYNYHKNKYYKNKHSLGAMFLYFIFRIKTYEKSPRNYPISEEMKKEINKMEIYNLEVRFMDKNRIDSYEGLHCYKEICKEALDDLIYARKRTYEKNLNPKIIILKMNVI